MDFLQKSVAVRNPEDIFFWNMIFNFMFSTPCNYEDQKIKESDEE